MYEQFDFADCKMTFGKYRGQPLRDIPDDYITWVVNNAEMCSSGLRYCIQQYLEAKQTPYPRYGDAYTNYTNTGTNTEAPKNRPNPSFFRRDIFEGWDTFGVDEIFKARTRKGTWDAEWDSKAEQKTKPEPATEPPQTPIPDKEPKCKFCMDSGMWNGLPCECVEGIRKKTRELEEALRKARQEVNAATREGIKQFEAGRKLGKAEAQAAETLFGSRNRAEYNKGYSAGLKDGRAQSNSFGQPAASPKAGGTIKKVKVKEVITAGRLALAKKYHPDINKDPAASGNMAECNAAADWLEKCAETLRQ